MPDFIKNNPSIVITVCTVVISIVTQWAVLGQRITAIEERQNRQGEAITDVKAQLATQASNYAELKAKIESMSDNINYIRSRIDRVTQ